MFLQVRCAFLPLWRASHELLSGSGSRAAGNLGPGERNKVGGAPASRHPQAERVVVGAGLTLWNASAYRCSVTRCRPVPHVHEEQLIRSGSCRGWAVPAESSQALPSRPVWLP